MKVYRKQFFEKFDNCQEMNGTSWYFTSAVRANKFIEMEKSKIPQNII